MATLLESALHVLWDDVTDQGNYPHSRPLWGHYTSVATLEKILQGDELWFSNPLYMNDYEELRYGMNTGASEFRTHRGLIEACGSARVHAKLVESFDELFHRFDTEHALDTYVLCLTEHDPQNNDGVLSMWRGYGANGGGVALVFDASKLPAVEDSPFIVSKVQYANHPTRLQWIDNKLSALAEVLRASAPSDDDLHQVAHAWIERLKLFALFTKHDGFSEEKEWRIVYFPDRDRDRSLTQMLGYAVTPKGVEPKLRVRLKELPGSTAQGLSLESLIERIILGPSLSTVLAAGSLRRMLELNGRHTLAQKILPSSIPYRP